MRTPTLESLAKNLLTGRTTSRQLTEECLARLADSSGEGSRTFIAVDAERARARADEIDALRARGDILSRFAGIPISVKDLFDIAGQVTRAGSTILAGGPPAQRDATIVTRLRAAGFVIVGRTNMAEFAYSGLGLNPHYGTPLNPWDRINRRAPGGSSSGAAVSVTDHMSHAAIGTDTGGSCRIPAAFCGLVGFKPTAHTVPLDGVVPLSPSLDSIGPIARSVRCCATLYSVLSDGAIDLSAPSSSRLRLAIPMTLVLDNLDPVVEAAFARAVRALSDAGIVVEERPFTAFGDLPTINKKGGLSAAESYAWHRKLIEERARDYDPRVLARIMRGKDVDETELQQLHRNRTAFIATIKQDLQGYNAMVLPTVASVAPKLDNLGTDEAYTRVNGLALRNTGAINFIDGCAISIPMHRYDEPPAGLMLAGMAGHDQALLQIAEQVENCLTSVRAA